MSELVKYLDAVAFDEALATTTGPLLVDFTAEWCPPCKLMVPVLDELAAERAGRLTIAKVDVDAEPEVAARYGVQSMPTMIVFVDGEQVGRFVGARPKRQLEADIEPWSAKECVGC